MNNRRAGGDLQEGRRHFASALSFALALVTAAVSAQTPAAPATTHLTFHDLAAMTRFPLGRMQTRGAMGETASIMITELPPGLKTTPHHHHQEQMMLGLAGGMSYLMGEKPYPLPRLTAAIALANVHHGNINDSTEPAACVEFQPVLRPDWYPPHPRVPRQGAPAPVPVPKDRAVTEDFSPASKGWKSSRNGARSKSLTGDTMRLTIWEFPEPAASAEVSTGPAVERFILVIDGQASISEGGGAERVIGKEMLVIATGRAKNVRLRAPKIGTATVAVYEPLK